VVTEWLDGKHTVFGQVRSGQEVVNAIQQGDQLRSVRIVES
jgi:cyclophilin family peptidyl-prolyl cis-trans isomerase